MMDGGSGGTFSLGEAAAGRLGALLCLSFLLRLEIPVGILWVNNCEVL